MILTNMPNQCPIQCVVIIMFNCSFEIPEFCPFKEGFSQNTNMI